MQNNLFSKLLIILKYKCNLQIHSCFKKKPQIKAEVPFTTQHIFPDIITPTDLIIQPFKSFLCMYIHTSTVTYRNTYLFCFDLALCCMDFGGCFFHLIHPGELSFLVNRNPLILLNDSILF